LAKIKVSICCITYNHEEYIADAIDGFLKQKVNFPIEILIHDDASTDKTPQIIESYRKKYPEIIKPIYQSVNQYSQRVKPGPTFLWPRAAGNYIALCEGDDYWTHSDKLQKQVDYMDENINCSVCFHASEIITADKILTNKLVKPYKQSQNVCTEDFILGGGGFFPTASLILRKHLIEDLPDFYFKSSVGDYPLILILSSMGKAYYLDEIMSVYRYGIPGSWTGMNLTNGNVEGKIKNCKSDIFILDEFNKYTNYIYNNTICKAILERKISICNFKQEKFKIFKGYSNYVLFKNINMESKIKLFLRINMPKIYKLLSNIKTLKQKGF
jgi:glycosyltransferase involved in cell wall biosynthesis